MAYTDTANIPLHMPVPGSKEPAQIALLNENCVTLSNHDHTTGKALAVGRMRSGLAANRPAAGSAGNVYFSTDTGIFNADTGTAWVQFLTSGGQATVTGWTLIDPVVRDTINWGPEGGAAIDATLTRTAPGELVMSGSGQKAWLSIRSSGSTGSMRLGQPVSPTQAGWIAANADYNGTDWNRDDPTKRAWMVTFGEPTYHIYSAKVAANPITWEPRFSLDDLGTATLYPNTGRAFLSIGGDLFLSRSAPFALNVSSTVSGSALGYFGVGQPDLAGWNAGICAIGVGGQGAVMANAVAPTVDPAGGTVALLHNGKYLAGGIAPIAAGAVTLAQVGQNGYFRVYNSVSGAAGTVATLTERLSITPVGTVNLNPNAGQPAIVVPNGSTALVFGYGHIRSVGATPFIDGQAGGYLFLGAGSGGTGNALVVGPANHNVTHLGWGDRGWALVHSVSGVVQDSLASDKQDFAPLDPSACVEAVLGTDWLSFAYKPPADQTLPERPEGLSDEEWSEQQERYAQSMADAALARKQRGYALGSDEFRVHELFGMADRKSAGTQSDLATVACALQDALRRLAALEGLSGQSGPQPAA